MNIEDIFNYDFRRFDTEHFISSLRRYLNIMEAQVTEAYNLERFALEATGPKGPEKEDYDIWRQEQQALEDLFDQQLRPAMYYSLVGLLHAVFETRLRAFCADIQKQLNIPIASREIRDSQIEQARTYLTKLAAFPIHEYPDSNVLSR